MRTWQLFFDFTPTSFGKANALLKRGLALNSDSAEANLVLLLINDHLALMGYAADTKLASEAAYALGCRAIQLDDRNEYAPWTFGISCRGLHKLDESIFVLERAVEPNPKCTLARVSLGEVQFGLGGPMRRSSISKSKSDQTRETRASFSVSQEVHWHIT